jgi:carboxymethylenebutenolidase
MTFEERIAADERIITRREALRLGVLVVSAPSIGTLLAACDDDGGQAGKADPSPTASPDAEARMVTFPGPRDKLKGAYAQASKPTGAVLVIHDNRGLTPHFVALAGRLAKAGYTALSIDLLSEEGGTAAIGGEAQAQQALSAASRKRVVADLRAGVDELGRRAPGQKVGAMGFSFGAETIWWLLDAPKPRVAAAVPIYGPFPEGTDLKGTKAAVLAMYAQQDSQVTATREAAEAALVMAGLKYELKFFLDADNGFFDETGPRYNQRAADAAYSAALDWFRIHLR